MFKIKLIILLGIIDAFYPTIWNIQWINVIKNKILFIELKIWKKNQSTKLVNVINNNDFYYYY